LTKKQAELRSQWSPEKREADRVRANLLRNAARAEWSPEKRSLEAARTQEWRESNRAAYLAGSRDWYWRNVEYARAKKLADYYANPEPFLARNFLRKARALEAVCEHGPDCVDVEFLTSVYGEPCAYCGGPAAEADHFYPLSRGGLHCRANIVPACLPCNRSKHASDPWDWMASRN